VALERSKRSVGHDPFRYRWNIRQALSLEQICLLLSVLLPLPPRRLEDVLAQIAYYQRRHAAARICHRQRTERWIADMDAPRGSRTRPIAPPIKA
jgi:hypothetical protein